MDGPPQNSNFAPPPEADEEDPLDPALQKPKRLDSNKEINWIERMHDWNHHCRHDLNDVIRTGRLPSSDGSGRHPWRLFDALPVYDARWATLSFAQITKEHRDDIGDPQELYFKHFFWRYEGEVALAWSNWDCSEDALPRDEIFLASAVCEDS